MSSPSRTNAQVAILLGTGFLVVWLTGHLLLQQESRGPRIERHTPPPPPAPPACPACPSCPTHIPIPATGSVRLTSQGGNPIDDFILNKLMHRLKFRGTFVEFGCADGVTNSNTYALEQLGWHGLCIEPNALEYAVAKTHRKNALNNLIAPRGTYTFATMKDECDQISGIVEFYSPEFMTIYNDCTARGKSSLSKVEARPLGDILDEWGMESVTYISADCEGCEYEFIKGFNFTRYDVQIFNYENNSVARRVRAQIDAILASHGFKEVMEAGDRVFTRDTMFQ